ncbi:MAG: hypothetical protein ACT4PL_11510 [Phycisphaerales bacterium]
MTTSYEEKSVWIQLVAMTIALGVYFVVAWRMMATGVREMAAFAPLFFVAVAVMVVLLVVAHTLAALVSRVENRDERDRLIAWKAEHRSAWVTAVGVLTGVTCLALGVESVYTAHLLLLGLTLSEMLGFVLQIVYYRKGV